MKRRLLQDYIAAYVDEVGTLDYADCGPPPYASLARGACGTAYMLWRLGHPRAASAWLSAASADRRRGAYRFDGLTPLLADPRRPKPNPLRSSYMYGRAGLIWLEALIGGRARKRALADFAALGTSAIATEDFMAGAAGYLTGARILLATTPHAGLRRSADAVAAALLERVRIRSEAPWSGRETTGFALRWPGAFHALLAWRAFADIAPPPWLIASLRRLQEGWSIDAVPTGFAATWCNGTAGMVLLWVAAFECTQDEIFLETARDMARAAETSTEHRSFLCCGRAGIAYALLELDRIDPRGEWRALATRSAELAVRNALVHAFEWPFGLYNGHPGIVCLAHDLQIGKPGRFPAIYG